MSSRQTDRLPFWAGLPKTPVNCTNLLFYFGVKDHCLSSRVNNENIKLLYFDLNFFEGHDFRGRDKIKLNVQLQLCTPPLFGEGSLFNVDSGNFELNAIYTKVGIEIREFSCLCYSYSFINTSKIRYQSMGVCA